MCEEKGVEGREGESVCEGRVCVEGEVVGEGVWVQHKKAFLIAEALKN